MKIGVLVKIVPDTETKIQVKTDGSGIDETAEIKYIINPYDEYALEEAMRLKESLDEGEVVVIFARPIKFNQDEPIIRKTLAMGADRAIYIGNDDLAGGDSYLIAKALTAALKKEQFNIIFAGKQAMDYDNSQIPQIVASLMNVPCITNVSKFEFKEGKATVEREIEGGTKEKWEISAPCIIGTTKELNEPRLPSLKGISQAKNKEIKKFAIKEIPPGMKKTIIKTYSAPPEKQAGRIVKTPEELIKALREEARII